jgi:stage II sporulation protein D
MLKIWSALVVAIVAATAALGVSVLDARQAEGASALKVCGSGNGHGVGLSQYGAYGRAQAGQKYPRIIKTYYRGATLTRYSTNPAVRVLLGERGLRGYHDVVVRRGARAGMKNLATGGWVSLGPGTYRIRYIPSKKIYRVINVSARKAVGSYTGPLVLRPTSGGPLIYGGRRYRGIFLVRTAGPRLYLINRLSTEAYIRGVVPNEMPASWSAEALKSQAVAARSYALATRRSGPFHFYADTRDQVYGGASSETAATNRAVADTARVYATYGGRPIKAFFHSADGGYTEAGSYVFGSTPYLKSFRDVDASGRAFESRVNSPWMRWSGTIDAGGSPQLGVGSITRVRVLSTSPSGRANKVEVIGTQGKKTLSGQYEIRYGLKTTGLRRADGSGYSAGYLPSARVSFGSAC